MTDQQIRLLWDEEIDSLILNYSANLLEHVAALIAENPHHDPANIVNGYRDHLVTHGINAEFPGVAVAQVEEESSFEDNEDLDQDPYAVDNTPVEESPVEEELPPHVEGEVEDAESLPEPVEFELDSDHANDDNTASEGDTEVETEHVETEDERREREDAEALAAYEAAVSGSGQKKKNFKNVLAHMTNIDKA